MLNKKKLTKYIWYDGQKWKLVQVVSPNKHDDFLLLSMKCDSVHDDGIPAIDMILINAHDDTFYTNTKEVVGYMKSMQEVRNKAEAQKVHFRNKLNNNWFSLFKEDW